jgi:hypothetical protein
MSAAGVMVTEDEEDEGMRSFRQEVFMTNIDKCLFLYLCVCICVYLSECRSV